MTLLHPSDGEVRLEGVSQTTNVILHGWLQQELTSIVAALPTPVPKPETVANPATVRAEWERWQEGLSVKPSLPETPVALRMLLILDNLVGHKSAAFVCWLFAHGIMPLYTPLGGSWLNMAESIQRILKRRALDGQHPKHPDEIKVWFKSVADHWNESPTPFCWGGKRKRRRNRQWERRHRTGGSASYTRKPIQRNRKVGYGHEHGK